MDTTQFSHANFEVPPSHHSVANKSWIINASIPARRIIKKRKDWNLQHPLPRLSVESWSVHPGGSSRGKKRAVLHK